MKPTRLVRPTMERQQNIASTALTVVFLEVCRTGVALQTVLWDCL